MMMMILIILRDRYQRLRAVHSLTSSNYNESLSSVKPPGRIHYR